ncbi:MAG TPA: alcohol dehydrogenase catalytic domain-containing protein [Candidatus Binataceae bacterium]|nr:alcohol dehydrogenase catalytic domain-containing protein [Candidatus Binataceae bacterium]
MRALVIDRELCLRTDYPDPQPAPGESIVRVELAGICGTDLEIVHGYMAYRGVLGHEFVGRVIQSANPKLAGARVVGEINAACGRCAYCADGLGRHCPQRTVLGILGRDGAFADFLRLPDKNLIAIPDSLAGDVAVFTEPLAAAYEILEQIKIPPNKSTLILGDGRLGAMVALALRGEGYEVVLGGHHREKLDRLSKLGFTAVPEDQLAERCDFVIDCAGSAAALARAIDLVKPRGTIVLKSTAALGANVNLSALVINEITVIGSRCGRFKPALDALAGGRVDPRPLIDATFALDEAVAAFEAARNPLNFKILVRPA